MGIKCLDFKSLDTAMDAKDVAEEKIRFDLISHTIIIAQNLLIDTRAVNDYDALECIEITTCS